MKSQVVGNKKQGFFQGDFIHEFIDGGNSDPSTLVLYIEQLGEVLVEENRVTIAFFGAQEANQFLEFCKAVVENNK